MIEKDFEEFIKKSKESLGKVEKHVESFTSQMSGDVTTFWGDLKEQFDQIGDTLKDAGKKLEDEAELQGKLGVMEAKDHAEKIKSASEEFLKKVTNDAQQEIDVAALKAHLAKMHAKDVWKEKEPELTTLYNDSKEEFEKVAKVAGKELSDILLKLTEIR